MVVNKSKAAFQTIAEVADELGVATHVLRFWETKFPQITPMKSSGGRRYYRPDDVELIKLIKDFLYNRRYTIEGVQKLFSNKGIRAILGGEIQKDFFESDTPAEEPLSQSLLPESRNLNNEQRQILQNLHDELNSLALELRESF